VRQAFGQGPHRSMHGRHRVDWASASRSRRTLGVANMQWLHLSFFDAIAVLGWRRRPCIAARQRCSGPLLCSFDRPPPHENKNLPRPRTSTHGPWRTGTGCVGNGCARSRRVCAGGHRHRRDSRRCHRCRSLGRRPCPDPSAGDRRAFGSAPTHHRGASRAATDWRATRRATSGRRSAPTAFAIQ
jgi:hypothetical protein